MSKNYKEIYEHLCELMGRLGEQSPELMAGFTALHEASTGEGALSAKTKELIALAIGITVRCDGCISYHVHDALAAGASHQELIETIGVAVMMGGGPSVVYGCEALEAIDQLSASALS